MSSSSAPLPTPEGPGSVSGAPNLPAGFTDTFTSRYIATRELRLHAVIGGEGPPLLLVHGWPETWYAWRLLMPALARDFEVVAVDQRGIGLTDKPEDGYDTGTLANDLVALMDALGHQRFAMVGHDTGLIISYALAADHPDRVDRVVLAEVPGPRAWLPHRPCSSPSRSTTGSGNVFWQDAVDAPLPDGSRGSGVAGYTYRYQREGGAWSDWLETDAATFNFAQSYVGEHVNVELRTRDRAGNVSDVVSGSVTVGTSPYSAGLSFFGGDEDTQIAVDAAAINAAGIDAFVAHSLALAVLAAGSDDHPRENRRDHTQTMSIHVPPSRRPVEWRCARREFSRPIRLRLQRPPSS